MWERCYKPGSVTRTSAGIQLSQSHKCQKIDCVQIITGVTDTRWWLDTDTDMRAWSHPCHGSSDSGKVRSVDTWHSSGVMWLVSLRSPGLWLAGEAPHLSTLSCLWLTLLSSSIVSKYWQRRDHVSWFLKILCFAHVMFVSCDWRSWSAKLEFLGWAASNASVVIADQSYIVINFNDPTDANLWPCDSDKNLFRNVRKLFKLFEKWGTRGLINTFGDLFSVIQVLGIWLG